VEAKVVDQHLQAFLVLDLGAVVRVLDLGLRLLVLGLERPDQLVEVGAPRLLAHDDLAQIRLALLHQVDLVLVLLYAVLKRLDLVLEVLELEDLVQHRARRAAHDRPLLLDLQLLLSSVALRKYHRVVLRLHRLGVAVGARLGARPARRLVRPARRHEPRVAAAGMVERNDDPLVAGLRTKAVRTKAATEARN